MTTEQLRAAGFSYERISHAAENGRLHRLHRGVYAVGHVALAAFAREQAALLACGKGAVLSLIASGGVWKILQPRPGTPIDVTVPGRALRPRPGIRVHRDTLTPSEIRTREGLPLTSPARTLIDLATVLDGDAWAAALSEARFLRLIREGELERALERAPGRAGTAAVRAHLRRENGPQLTQSEAERLFLKLVRQAGLPEPRTQVTIEGYRVDAAWPERRLVVELDGIEGHGHRSAFERDRRRDAILIAAGWRVVRFTWPQLAAQRCTSSPPSVPLSRRDECVRANMPLTARAAQGVGLTAHSQRGVSDERLRGRFLASTHRT